MYDGVVCHRMASSFGGASVPAACGHGHQFQADEEVVDWALSDCVVEATAHGQPPLDEPPSGVAATVPSVVVAMVASGAVAMVPLSAAALAMSICTS